MTSDILWHNSATGEIRVWFLNGNRRVDQASVLGHSGTAAAVGEPWRIVAATDLNPDRNASIIWHHATKGFVQIWSMDREWLTDRVSVVDEDGAFAPVGLPWGIVGVGDFDGNGTADILWHNSDTGEIQIWFMDKHQRTGRASVVDEAGVVAPVGLPWGIVGVGDFDGNGTADILWHNSDTGEIQIWFMDKHQRTGRASVVDEAGVVAPVGLPWGIVGVGDFDRNGTADILWHNSDTGEIQIWFMDKHQRTRRASVVDESGAVAPVGPPFRIVGVGGFNELGRVKSPVMEFTFDSTITTTNRNRLIARHLFALARGRVCGNLDVTERAKLREAYAKRIHHSTSTNPDENAHTTLGGSTIWVNFAVLFPKGDDEIAQTLIHEMMHCAEYDHPEKRVPQMGQPFDPTQHDSPHDGGKYFSSPPLRAELCIAGDQSDKARMARIEQSMVVNRCSIEGDIATIHVAAVHP